MSRRLRVLLTAFEPFDGTGLNASLEGCRAFLAGCEPASEPRFAVLPVAYDRDTEVVERALAEGPFDVILHTGQAHNSAALRVERFGANRRYAPGDTRPEAAIPIDSEGADRFESTWDAFAVTTALEAGGLPARVSDSAGIYLCNHVLYRSLQRRAASGEAARIGFLHVPRLPEQAAPDEPSLPAAEIARAIALTLGCMLECLERSYSE